MRNKGYRPPPPREAVLKFISLMKQGRLSDAITHGEAMAKHYAGSLNLYNMLGSANIQADRRPRAIEWFRKALETDPHHVDTLYNMAITSQELGRKTEAIHCFERILRIKPDSSYIRALKLLLQANICDWDAIYADESYLKTIGIEGDIAPPFAMLALEDRPDRHRIRSERYSAKLFQKHHPMSVPVRPEMKPDRLRIGYFSAEVRNHPVARLIARVLELHDRSRFEVHLFSYGPIVEDETRARVTRAVDYFHEVGRLTEQDIADLARYKGIDIAVDLTGHTTYARTGIFSLRPAPVQISYLGYPGTMGAPFIDYIIVDEVLVPDNHRRFFTESPIYLPHCYQAQDDQIKIADSVPSRASLGLPKDGFVFCGINNSYKITRKLYDVWMSLLKSVDESVLWLLESSSWAKINLRRQAAIRGVDPERIIFSDWKNYSEYVSQFSQADLFLDSFVYNAGATASNALWAGLPVLTRIGNGYPTRMAASMLRAVDLTDLITTTDEDYQRLALALATDPAKLSEIRERLATNRRTKPLFDSSLFTRHVEEGYMLAYGRWLAGETPAAIHVPDLLAASASGECLSSAIKN